MDTCFVFVDDSNLWISGKKVQAQKLKLKDAKEDPRFRVDLGRLLELTVGKRDIFQAHLYGSSPPPNDSVWRAISQKNFKVEVFDRAGGVEYGREKEVDHAMTAAVTEWATMLTYDRDLQAQIDKKNVAFVVVTGDRDMKAAIDITIKRKIKVELWSWRDSIATVYKQLANQTQLLVLREFDSVSDKFTYTSMRSTRSRGDISPANTIVFRGISQHIASIVPDMLLRLYRVFYISKFPPNPAVGQPCDLIVEFPYSRAEQVMKELRQQRAITRAQLDVCSYPEYQSHSRQQAREISQFTHLAEVPETDLDEALNSLHIDEDIHSQPEPPTDATDEASSQDSDSWTVVLRRKPGAKTRRDKMHSTPCRWGIHCAKASECPRMHTEVEKKLFRVNEGFNFHYWKSNKCDKSQPHAHESCRFAHESSDAWCLICKSWGHFTDDCKSKLAE